MGSSQSVPFLDNLTREPLFHLRPTRPDDDEGFGGIIYMSNSPRPDGLTAAAMTELMTTKMMLVQFNNYHDLYSLDSAIDPLERLINLTSDAHTLKYQWCWTLASLFVRRYAINKDQVDIDKAIAFYGMSIDLAPEFYDNRADHFYQVGLTYMEHHGTPGGDHTDADNAEIFFKRAIGSFLGAEPPAAWTHLGIALAQQYDFSDSPEDLDQAIAILRITVNKCADDVLQRRNTLTLLSALLSMRFHHSGNEQDAEELDAIVREAAVGATNQAISALSRSSSLVQRFRHSRRSAELDEAVSILKELLASTSEPEIHSFRGLALNALSQALHERFANFHDPRDQESSLITLKEAMKECFDEKTGLADLLSNLGTNCFVRFEHSNNADDLDEAIAVTRQAIEVTAEGHWAKHSRWGDLSALLRQRYLSTGRIDDMKEGHICCERALRDLPDNHRDKAKLLRYLGQFYMDRFHAFHQAEDIDKAVEALLAAVEATPTDYPERVMRLWDLGGCFLERFGISRDLTDVDQTVSVFKTASLLDKGSFFFRMRASWHWGESIWRKDVLGRFDDGGQAPASSNSTCDECYRAFSRMMDLVPPSVWLGDTIAVRHDALILTSALIRRAAAIIIHYRQSIKAVEWLEQGRSVVWRQQLNLRTRFDELQEVEPTLAARMRAVSTTLDRASIHQPDDIVSQPGELLVDEAGPPRRRLAEQWENLLVEARKVPGFERLLQPKQISELRRAARDGPIVVLNEGMFCDALIVLEEKSDVLRVPLGINLNQAEQLHSDLSDLLMRSNTRSRLTLDKHADYVEPDSQDMRRILLSLWTGIVKPVLNMLHLPVLDKSESHPRITWCPTGVLAFLPIHAAGDYTSDEPGHRISDYVVSSYTTTISSLLDASHHPASSEFQCLAVSQRDTPGLTSLPYTELEIRKVRERVGHMQMEELAGEAATVAAVHDAMERCSWIHLACHAIQDPNDPLKSAFCLADGRLQLQDIIRKTHPHADFAFLSACQTSTGDQKLSDEAVHLAAGMQLAGYRSIIATMWSIGDEDGPLVADEVYAYLLRDGKPDSSRAAYALHHAVLKLQEATKPDERDDSWFLRWVPFIHIGA